MRTPGLGLTLVFLLAACGTQDTTPTSPDTLTAQALSPTSLGARYTDSSGTATGTSHITFRVYSSRASRIEVYLYAAASGQQEKVRYVLTKNTTTNVWSSTVSVDTLKNTYGITGPVYYGYRAWGPNWTYSSSWTKGSSAGFVTDVDANGNRFNPNKLLLDPYALEISHDPISPSSGNYSGTVYASGADHRLKDSGVVASKGIVLASDTSSYGTKPSRALKDDVIYEVHLRGLSKGDSSVSCAGTYAGAGAKAAALQSLGVTAVEFLPVQETDNDANDANDSATGRSSTSTSGDNYWGYMTLNYFAPDRRYSCDKSAGGPTREFKAMVKAFHDRGIKVFIDVVYNHTGEGGTYTSTDPSVANIISWRGLDNPTYYELTSDNQYYYDNTGVGGNYNTYNPVAQNLIVDSLKYWRDELGVDGYRFDLASVLGNTCTKGCFNYDKLDSNTALNRIVRDVPPRPAGGGSGVDLIAEPWAIGGNSYQVGNFPSGWSEWNGYYRDLLRKDQNKLGSESVTPAQLATRFAGSSDLYGDDGRKPWNSVNFMVAHDGFTLKDLYSCNNKNNSQAWPYGPSDGGEDHNNSWDQAGVASDQRKAARNGLAFLMLNAGTPMLTGGDEFLRGVNCNNNPYNLDSGANWLNYSLNTDQTNFKSYAQNMIAFRKAHPALRPASFYSSADTNGNVMEQLRWFKPDGQVPDSTYWNDAANHALAYRIDGTEFGDSASAIYVAYNGWSGSVNFTLPWPGAGKSWYRVTDTCPWAEGSSQVDLNAASNVGGEYATYGLCGRSVLVLIAK
ncbi:isoamylase [Deinococcus peraridilitoris]|uniref:Pullulanase-like glycosidase possibly secreted by type II secretory pathway n=1 Tax=Deinococcus peraridilitoris (strain DSM 19664 / LMG 22246 / CIP 109416 / KR-200) TaxID=937777 RepID=K9ZZB6_DEIPD|nr:isoamylase [Deinococcus peraridilitoris]AFZ66941.1 pullulanase-like glycosidase possibly secreted by type II secretory pathway [Deinococcus peraridilitoris DSM 19664]